MKLIKFIQAHGKFQINTVIGTKDSDAAALVASGVAVYEQEGIKPLKYAPGIAPRMECVTPIFEEMEASPKGAVWPEEMKIETVDRFEEIETADVKYKQKQLKK